jgi:hypothetical protein
MQTGYFPDTCPGSTVCAKNVKGFLSYAKYCTAFHDTSLHKADY